MRWIPFQLRSENEQQTIFFFCRVECCTTCVKYECGDDFYEWKRPVDEKSAAEWSGKRASIVIRDAWASVEFLATILVSFICGYVCALQENGHNLQIFSCYSQNNRIDKEWFFFQPNTLWMMKYKCINESIRIVVQHWTINNQFAFSFQMERRS